MEFLIILIVRDYNVVERSINVCKYFVWYLYFYFRSMFIRGFKKCGKNLNMFFGGIIEYVEGEILGRERAVFG